MTIERARAKLNLALHVRRRRADGYHDIETLFAFCTHGDTVEVEPAERDTLVITGPFADGLGNGEDNLVTRAAHAFTRAFGITQRHAIALDKQLPVASGLGGGSADAAATLRALARMHSVASDDPALLRLAAALGADVPACLLGLTAFGSDRGDALAPISGRPGTPVLLVNPGVHVSTAAVFAGWDGIDRGGLGEGELIARARAGRNDLEPPARAVAPVIGEVLDLLAAPGVLLSRMSGSGATCFALVDEARLRASLAAAARARGWWVLETALA